MIRTKKRRCSKRETITACRLDVNPTAAMCDRLKARKLEKLIRKKTGLVLDAYFSGTKLQWILQNVPGAKAKAKAGQLAFGTID